ncbi:chorismate-binding protein [Actinomycetospora sp. NBRC 106378]|uniref:chorismate-binding protein n=1 Tax=Actinomycetospora sp. NBRC 106378 TaxID=3032208 RepID=UPI0024A1205B|nr:chorismate-binding protein [Actinomycetospora sp. NBRC 106378]GLZ53120.1 aminodeoxychorismate synthase, component I [Actinomycetospora sp. NBRC 106378]
MRARFDDLRADSAVAFDRPAEVLTAGRADEVPDVLAAVDAATASGRWAYGYLAYEAAPGLDPDLVTHRPDPDGPPVARFALSDVPPRPVPVVAPGPPPPAAWSLRTDAATHAAAVARIHDRIAAGETYQVNLTGRVDGTVRGDPADLYPALVHAQRGAHHARLDLGRWVVASASPELFVRRDGDTVTVRPMKGTAPRGRTTGEDAAAAATLHASAKDRAENVMIVDLLRHDVARVGDDVRVTDLCTPERYPTVWQLTSGITATARPGTGLLATMRALFPCGSVTGAPKIATMRLITELEDSPRGVYCGAIGWVGPGSRAEFAVAIRTVVADRATGRAVYGTGGGITWDSRADAEWAELRAKATVLGHRPVEGLLETFAVRDGHPVRLERHLARLADSAAHLDLDDRRVRSELATRLRGVRDARVRLVLPRSGTPSVELHPLPDAGRGPVRLAPPDACEPVDPTATWPHHKTTDRSPYEQRLAAARRAYPDADDAILVNTAGELTETTTATLAVRLGGTWYTPPLGGGALPGVARAELVERGELVERTLTAADLDEATGLAVVNSLRGWRPAQTLRGAYMMTATPARQSSAPSTSNRSGR